MVHEGMPIFVGEVAKYEVKNGHLHVVYRRLGLELVVPISVALSSWSVVGEALAMWKLGTMDNGTVVRLGRGRK